MKGKYIVIILICGLLLVNGTRWIAISQNKSVLQEDANIHLHEKDYESDDVVMMHIIRESKCELELVAFVTFRDESNVEYLSVWQERKKWIGQFDCASP